MNTVTLQYVHVHVIYRVHRAEYGIRIFVAAFQQYVNTSGSPERSQRANPSISSIHSGSSQTATSSSVEVQRSFAAKAAEVIPEQ